MNRSGVTSGAAGGERLRTAKLRAARDLAHESTVAEVVEALTERGAQPLLIKGVVFARWLYDDPTERSPGDVDLLLAPDQFEPARLAMAELGFRKRPSGSHAHEQKYHDVWVRDGPPRAVVELHHTVFFLTAPPALVWDRFSRDMQTATIAGTPVSTPSPAVNALVVALHAINHGIAYPKPQRDLQLALQRVDLETWRGAAVLAEELGAAPAFAAGLRLGPGGLELCRRLGLLHEAGSRYFRLRANTSPDGAIGIERLLTTPGFGPRLKLIVLELVPSPGFMRNWYPLARRGRRGLAASYAWRPVHLAIKLPGGLRGWRSAARPNTRAGP